MTSNSQRSASSSGTAPHCSLVDVAIAQAGALGDRPAFYFVEADGTESGRLSYGELDQRSRAVAAGLQEVCKPGDRVLILLPPGLDYVVAFFGCLYAGTVAVPAYPPEEARLARMLPRIQAIAKDASAAAVLTTPSLAAATSAIAQHAPELAGLHWFAVGDAKGSSAWSAPALDPQTLAFLQYTSGSTGTPKGVMLSHANLLHNLRAIQNHMGHTRDSVMVSWVPPFHDMGLIVGILQPFFVGFPSVLLAPATFVRNPYRWLEALTRYKGTTSASPNFGYDLCVRKISEEQKGTLDLRSWQLAINAAEPVRAQTLAAFSQAFACCGFQPRLFYPAYGLAEGTVMVSGIGISDLPKVLHVSKADLEQHVITASPGAETHTQPLVACGTSIVDQQIRIVDPQTLTALAEGKVGEVWVAGPSVAQGYWKRAEESRDVFEGRLADQPDVRFLRTGDLGFLWEGQLFITGRHKDLIILAGQNIYPQDIEASAERSHKAVRPGCSAAFSILDPEGSEQIAVVLEVDTKKLQDPNEVFAAIRGEIASSQGVSVAALALIEMGSIGKTSSGKIQRRATRKAFLEGKLKLVAEWRAAPSESVVGEVGLLDPTDLKSVASWIAARLATRLVSTAQAFELDRSLAEYGLNSLTALEVSSELALKIGVELPATLLIGASTLREAASMVVEAYSTGASGEVRAAALRKRVVRAGPGERAIVLRDYLREETRAVLKLGTGPLGEDEPLSRMGMDSLHAVELQHIIDRVVGVTVPVDAIVGGASLRGLLNMILEAKSWGRAPESVAPASKVATYTPSLGQQALWFLQRLTPENSSYNIPFAARIRAKVDVDALQKALQDCVDRHDALRTTFLEVEGKPIAFVHDHAPVAFERIDASKKLEAYLLRELQDHAGAPFDLEQGPLFHAALFSRSPEDHVLLLCFHHTVTDFWSIEILLQELGILYQAHVEHRTPGLPPPGRSYAEHVTSQTRLLDSEEGERQWHYFKKALGGAPSVLDLPTDRARPANQSFEGASLSFALDSATTKAVKEFCAAQGVTLYTCLLSAFQVLLHRYTGQEDFLLGSPVSGRTRPEWANTVGYFVNTTVLRAQLDPTSTFADVLKSAREGVLGALRHQDFPFPLLVERLLSRRDPSRPPLFQVLFGFQTAHRFADRSLTAFSLRSPGASMTIGGLPFESLSLPGTTAQVDLSLTLGESNDGILGLLEYCFPLYEERSVRRLQEHYVALLQAAIAQPTAPLSTLSMVLEEEKRLVLEEWNATNRPLSDKACLHHLVEQQVARCPDSIAVVQGNRSLTYRELNDRAEALAALLQSQGVKEETIVGVALEPSLELAITLLAVLKAGGAYLPLDPHYPLERLLLMVEDSETPLLLLSKRQAQQFEPCKVQKLFVEEAISSGQAPTGPLSKSVVTPTSLAYVIYTSGSTGRPKGVQVLHRGVVNFLASMAREPGLKDSDVLLSVTTPSFDIFGLELYLPLSLGAKVVLAGREVAQDGEKLAQLIDQSGATTMQATPTTWRLVLEAGGWKNKRPFRALVGGEALPLPVAKGLRGLGATVWNLYGPTETTIWSTVHEVGDKKGSIPIGHPIDNTQVYVLDSARNLVPAGMVGEIYIAGAGVARGYLRRPELTQEAFLPDPFSKDPSARMYRTGDLGRWTRRGILEYVGRRDGQLKLRGHRIELGEIEACLEQHPEVKEAVALVREIGPGDDRLVVWYVAPQADPGAEALAKHARKHLPEIMTPSAYVRLDSLPLTPNGKVDRKALRSLPLSTETSAQAGQDPPRNALETRLVQIWAEYLGLKSVGIHDDFFKLGGHSLLAARVTSHLRNEFRIELPVGRLFEAPTVAVMGKVVEEARGKSDAASEISAVFGPEIGELSLRGANDPSFMYRVPRIVEDSVLPDDLCLRNTKLREPSGPPERILVTGATGFLGAFLVQELAARTQAQIFCHARASSPEAAKERVRANLDHYGLWNDSLAARLVGVNGDLEQPRLGIESALYDNLAESLDVIFHGGAFVDFVRPYRVLKPANVGGTIEVLRLASRKRLIPVHHISTMSVFPSLLPGTERTADENDSLALEGKKIHGEYAKSKWVSDRICMQARDSGLPVSIFRPGIVYAHATTGVGKTDDFVHRMVQGAVQLKAFPIIETWVNLTPVDFVAQGIVHIALQTKQRKVFHFVNPLAITVDAFYEVVRDFGYPMERIPYKEWRAKIASTMGTTAPNALLALLPYLTEESGELFRQPFFKATNTTEGLRGTGIDCRPADRDAIFTWLHRLVRIGLLPLPAR